MKKTTLALIFAVLLVGTAAMTLTVERPQAIIKEAFGDFERSGSFAFKGTVDTVFRAKLPVGGSGQAVPDIALPLHIVGNGALALAAAPQVGGVVGAGPVGTMRLIVADELTSKELFGLEMRATDSGSVYMRLEGGEAVAGTGTDISKVADRWFAVDGAATRAFGVGQDDHIWSELWAGLSSGAALSYREQTASEVIDGSSAWHFIFDTRPGAFNDALTGLYGMLSAGGASQATTERVRSSMSKHSVSAEVWIDKETKKLVRFGLAVVPPPSETVVLPLALVVDLSEYGRAVDVDVPDGAEPLSDVITSLLARPTVEDNKKE